MATYEALLSLVRIIHAKSFFDDEKFVKRCFTGLKLALLFPGAEKDVADAVGWNKTVDCGRGGPGAKDGFLLVPGAKDGSLLVI